MKKTASHKTAQNGKTALKNTQSDVRSFGSHFFGRPEQETKVALVERNKQYQLFLNLDTRKVDDVIEQCGFDYEVKEDALKGVKSKVEFNHRGMYHSVTNAPLGVVGTSYTAIQPTEALAAFDQVVQARGGRYVAGGYVRNGSRLFVVTDFGGAFEVRKDDRVVNHMLLSTSFDGSGAYQLYEIPERLLCSNQLAVVLNKQTRFLSIPHTANVKDRMHKFLGGLSHGKDRFKQFEEECKRMQQVKLDKKLVDALLDGVFGECKEFNAEGVSKTGAALSAYTRTLAIREEVENLINGGVGNRGETLWDAYNGVTEYIDHHRGADEDRTESVLFGSGRRMNEKALSASLALV